MSEFVLLLRSGDEPDPYERALRDDGFEVRSVPVLDFDFVNGEGLRDALEHPNSYDGLIFTSPRAVDALGKEMPWLPSETVLWHNKPVFAVGPGTADALRSIGFEPDGEESGSAEMLADFIARRPFSRPLLFLCGDRHLDVLSARLHASGIEVEELCVYASRSRTNFDWPADREPDWVVFFSPSGYEAVQEGAGDLLLGVRIVAIGPTTAEALRADGHDVAAVAAEPSPGALGAAIRTAGGREIQSRV